jgi:hypothetical protein
VLWHKSKTKSFITFTLPSYEKSNRKFDHVDSSQTTIAGTYQQSTTCPDTGDISIAKKFSRTLEAWRTKIKRDTGELISYVWVAEAQMKRKEKYGGVGDLHYHLVVNQKLKSDNGNWCDYDSLLWLQQNWNSQLGTNSNNCVDVRPIPERITSVPSYLSKYLGKGHQRPIMSRSFQATQDLSGYKPIHVETIPTARLTRETQFTTQTGYDVISRYFNTRDVMNGYSDYMRLEGKLRGPRAFPGFSDQEIMQRKYERQQAQLHASAAQGLSYST